MKLRGRRPPTANGVPPPVVVGVAVQVVGFAAQALFHLDGEHLPWLTERRAAATDHILSNAGVLCLTWQVGRWLPSGSAWSHAGRRLVTVGTGVEAAGAVADGVGHVLGGEHRVPVFAIVAGYVTVVIGAVLSARHAASRA